MNCANIFHLFRIFYIILFHLFHFLQQKINHLFRFYALWTKKKPCNSKIPPAGENWLLKNPLSNKNLHFLQNDYFYATFVFYVISVIYVTTKTTETT